MIIGINGKIGSGKDTVGSIIQYLTAEDTGQFCLNRIHSGKSIEGHHNSSYEIKKFAGKLKQTGSLLTGIPVEMFEDQEFKKTNLSNDWSSLQQSGRNKVLLPMTVREFLQKLGTEAMRDGLHTNVWVNALFADYHPTPNKSMDESFMEQFVTGSSEIHYALPKWIITDMRFPNEMEAVELREGVTIKVVRYKVGDKVYWTDPEGVSSGSYEISEVYQDFCCIYNDFSEAEVPYHEVKHKSENLHASETALDDAHFDHVISNNGTIDELVERVREILTIEEIL